MPRDPKFWPTDPKFVESEVRSGYFFYLSARVCSLFEVGRRSATKYPPLWWEVLRCNDIFDWMSGGASCCKKAASGKREILLLWSFCESGGTWCVTFRWERTSLLSFSWVSTNYTGAKISSTAGACHFLGSRRRCTTHLTSSRQVNSTTCRTQKRMLLLCVACAL